LIFVSLGFFRHRKDNTRDFHWEEGEDRDLKLSPNIEEKTLRLDGSGSITAPKL